MAYNQGLPSHGFSWPQRTYYDPYPRAHHNAAPSYYQPPPPGTERAVPAAGPSSSLPAAGASYHVTVAGANPPVAAPSQPTSFAASIGAFERGMGHQAYHDLQYPPPPAQHPAAVGVMGTLMGRSAGGEPSYGGGRGQGSSVYHPPIWNAGVTSPHGRGQERGRGRGRGRNSNDRQLTFHTPAGPSSSEAQPGTASGPTTNIARGPVVPAAWCDICRVECNSKEILEQHKNGKRHKRTVQRMQDMACLQSMTPAIAGMAAPSSQVGGFPATSQLIQVKVPSARIFPPLGSSSIAGGEHKCLAPENVMASFATVQVTEMTGNPSQQNTAPPTATVGHNVEAQIELHAAAVQTCQPSNMMKDGGKAPPSNAAAKVKVTGNSSQQNTTPPTATVGHSVETQIELHTATTEACQPSNVMKDGGEAPPSNATCPSNMQLVETRMDVNGSRNGPKRKMMGAGRGGKKLKASQTPRQRSERVREQPLVCTICNVTCNTRAVFDMHLGGKKHQSRVKRSQDVGTLFGPLVAHTPNQPAPHPIGAPEPLYYGLKSRYIVEQEAYLVGAMQQAFPVLSEAGPTIMAAEGVFYPTQRTTGAMDAAGNGGSVTAPLGLAAVETDAQSASAPAPSVCTA